MHRVKAFLSHKYEAPVANRFFYEFLTTGDVELQFEVDEGRAEGKRIPTNVTRLERMIRDADVFVGICVLEEGTDRRSDPATAFRYFRLEMDMAARAGLPSLVFYDKRYARKVSPPPEIRAVGFDPAALPDRFTDRELEDLRTPVEAFLRQAEAWLGNRAGSPEPRPQEGLVGLCLPPGDYEGEAMEEIEYALRLKGLKAVPLPWPPCLQSEEWSVNRYDWLLVDTGPRCAKTGIVSWLHGRMVPMMRVRRVTSEDAGWEGGPLDHTLFGGLAVGYVKDEVRWRTPEELSTGIIERIDTLRLPTTGIRRKEEAQEYFRRAGTRPERVFLSFSREDQEFAVELTVALERHFESVLNYRRRDAILAGTKWMKELTREVQEREVGVILHSEASLGSDYCEYERDHMARRMVQNEMVVIPLKLDPEGPGLPDELEGTQYLHVGDGDPARIAADIRRIVREHVERR